MATTPNTTTSATNSTPTDADPNPPPSSSGNTNGSSTAAHAGGGSGVERRNNHSHTATTTTTTSSSSSSQHGKINKQTEIIISHESTLLPKKTSAGNTHRWVINVNVSKMGESSNHLVKSVTYRLHESFKNPIRVLNSEPFSLSETGWGSFTLVVEVLFSNGQRFSYKYDLILNALNEPSLSNSSKYRVNLKSIPLPPSTSHQKQPQQAPSSLTTTISDNPISPSTAMAVKTINKQLKNSSSNPPSSSSSSSPALVKTQNESHEFNKLFGDPIGAKNKRRKSSLSPPINDQQMADIAASNEGGNIIEERERRHSTADTTSIKNYKPNRNDSSTTHSEQSMPKQSKLSSSKEEERDSSEMMDCNDQTSITNSFSDESDPGYKELLIDLQKKIQLTKDTKALRNIVKCVERAGYLQKTSTSFDFDLNQLDKTTIVKIRNFLKL